jgi:Putative adhesin
MQQSFDVAGPVELEIRLASGDITIDPSLKGRVEVELTAYDDESQRLVDEATIELRESHGGPQVVVEVPNKRGLKFDLGGMFGRQGITCHVRCPQGSGVSAKTKSADLRAHGVLGGLHVQTASGDVEADRVTGGVNVKSASGDVTVREVGDGVSLHSASGDVDIAVARGPVNVNSVSGDVTIGEAYDNVNVNTVSGDQDHGAVMQGSVHAHSVSGDVSIGVRRGSKVFLDCNTMSGDTRSDLELSGDVPDGDGPLVEIRAKTVSGDIRITRASAPSESTQGVHA